MLRGTTTGASRVANPFTFKVQGLDGFLTSYSEGVEKVQPISVHMCSGKSARELQSQQHELLDGQARQATIARVGQLQQRQQPTHHLGHILPRAKRLQATDVIDLTEVSEQVEQMAGQCSVLHGVTQTSHYERRSRRMTAPKLTHGSLQSMYKRWSRGLCRLTRVHLHLSRWSSMMPWPCSAAAPEHHGRGHRQ